MRPTELSKKLAECAELARRSNLKKQLLRKFNFTELAIAAGWTAIDNQRFLREEVVGYSLFDVTLQKWLTIPPKDQYSATDLQEWASAFARMETYALNGGPKIPKGKPPTINKQIAKICMDHAEIEAVKTGIFLKTAALRLFPQYGFVPSQYEAVYRSAHRQA